MLWVRGVSWEPNSDAAVSCENGQVLLSSVQFWNFVFFPENDSFHLCFPIMFLLLIIFSCGFVNLCCVYCHNPFSFLTLFIFASSSFLIILIRCLPSLLDFSIDWLLGFCQCSLLFSFSLISAVWCLSDDYIVSQFLTALNPLLCLFCYILPTLPPYGSFSTWFINFIVNLSSMSPFLLGEPYGRPRNPECGGCSSEVVLRRVVPAGVLST